MVVAVWQEEQAQKCPNCGTFEWEWEEDPNAWHPVVHWCLGCRGVQLEKRAISDGADKDPEGRAGWQVRLMKGADDGS